MKTLQQIMDQIGRLQAVQEKCTRYDPRYERVHAQIKALFWVQYDHFAAGTWLEEDN